jgi:hypothetical protein
LLVGAYWYLYVDQGLQVPLMVTQMGTVEGGCELGAWLDQEKYGNENATWQQWEVIIHSNTKYLVDYRAEDPGFYTSFWMWQLTGDMDVINGKPAREYRMWVAHWSDVGEPWLPEPWDTWEFWQKGSDLRPDWNHAPSNRTDWGVFNGTDQEFYAKYGIVPDPEPDPDPDPEPNGGDEMNEMEARLLIVVETDKVLRFFNPDFGDEVFLDLDPEPEPEPDPEPIPEPGPVDLSAYMLDGGTYKDVTDRFEILNAEYTAGGYLNFHIKTLKDKMSMQGGELVIVPMDLVAEPDMIRIGSSTITSPRKPDFPESECDVRWVFGPGYVKSLKFYSDGSVVEGSATTSQDHPWNWHYGFEILGSIEVS